MIRSRFTQPPAQTFTLQYWCLYRPIWRDAEPPNYQPTTRIQTAMTDLQRLFRERGGRPVRIVDETGAEYKRLP